MFSDPEPLPKELEDLVAFEIGVLHMNYRICARVFKGDTLDDLLDRVSSKWNNRNSWYMCSESIKSSHLAFFLVKDLQN